MRIYLSAVVLCAVVAASTAANSSTWIQPSAPLTLGPATASLKEEFSGLTSVRELADGRVLLTDGTERRLVIADFGKNSVASVGRAGNGPGEFTIPVPLLALPNDSTAMINRLSRRWIIIDPKLALTTLPPDAPIISTVGTNGVIGFDGAGRMLVSASAASTPDRLRDTLLLMVVASRTLSTDTLAWRLDAGPVTPPRVAGAPDQLLPYRMRDAVTIAPDGWIAVVRWQPYRVDWRRPDGTTVLGAPVAEPPVRIDARFKADFLARACERIRRVIGGPCEGNSGDAVQYGPWPEVLPPFAARTLMAAPNGELLVQRTSRPGETNSRYDVFDRTGARRYQVLLPSNRTPLGFGRGSLYVVTTDSVGIQTLSRHTWPMSRPR